MSASSSVSAAGGEETYSREGCDIGDSELGTNAWERPIAAMRSSRSVEHFMVVRGNQLTDSTCMKNEATCKLLY